MGLFRFEWDEKKAASNQKKHKISFEIAITIFDDPNALIAPDLKHSNFEAREWIIGESDKDILVVIFTKRMDNRIYRIISARKANKKERELYEKFKKFSF